MSTSGIDPKQALEMLLSGNSRYVSGNAVRPHQDTARRTELAAGQKPFAIVLTCSDSRVAPEILFDQGLGDIFVVRTAGNIADDVALGSIEYAAEHLGSRLIVVLGHQKCGAVTAAVQGGDAQGHIASIIRAIQPAVSAVKGQEGDAILNATIQHVRLTVSQIAACPPIIDTMATKGQLQVVGALYALDKGTVTLI